MENQESDYQEILKRIHTTPSVLFMGQNYLSEVLSSSISELSKNESEAQFLLDYREILSLRWNAIVSSSFDANIPNKCGESFSFEVRSQYDKSQEIGKAIKAGYFLFGQSSNGKNPPKPDLELDSSSKDIFLSVLKKTIDSYGIVIISGWNLETDWIAPKILYDVLKDAPAQSVLLFGTKREEALGNKFIKELTKKQLSEKDIIEDTFYVFLQQNGFFDTHFEDDDFSLDSNVETLSLYSNNYKDGRIPFVIKIPKDTIYELNSKSITIITDSTGSNNVSKTNDNLLRFCTCKGDWSYYAPHNKLIVNRKINIENNTCDFYEYTDKLIDKILKKGKKRNSRYICVAGIHYSGKTALLKSFALRNKHKYPIFYIENYADGVTEELLRKFCIHSINKPEEFSQEVVVMCDFKTASDYDMQRSCLKIKNTFSEISGLYPIVIGTTYSDYEFFKNQLITVPLSYKLDNEEIKNIKSVYSRVDPDFQMISSNNSIFEIISKNYKYNYSPEAADLRVKMNEAHAVNQTAAQNNVNEAYGQKYDEEYNIFIKNGILSSFNNLLDANDARYKEIKNNLKKINDCIALASEFGIELPSDFIFRMLGWSNYKFLEALNADCFLKQTEIGFRYISAYEAGKYLLFNYTDDIDATQDKEAKLKEKEIDILCIIIESCNWNGYDESSKIISLIRKFSPNSIGKDTNIIGNKDKISNLSERRWFYYNDYYERVGNKILRNADTNNIAVIVASAFLRRAFNKNDKKNLIDTAYNSCKVILDNHTVFDSSSINEKIEVYIEICNVIIATFPRPNDLGNGNFNKWEEFIFLFQSLVGFYDKTDKLEASVILSIWYRAVEKKASKQDTTLFEQTIFYESAFLSDINSEYDFEEAISNYKKISDIYSDNFSLGDYKGSNLKGWLLYQQRDSYKLELNNDHLGDEEIALANQILSIFNESEETKSAVLEQPLLLKTKILCDWIIKFHSSPYAEENPISFTDTIFWRDILKNIDMYLRLCNENHPPAAFIKYIKCVYSLVFDDGSYRFEENVRHSKKLIPWYAKRIGIADENGNLLKFTIGTIPQRDKDNFRGKISDSNSIYKNLSYIHLSPEVQKYLAEGKVKLFAMTSILDKPVNIFFNAAGATAAIPPKEGGNKE